ncbi:EcsC protein family protein [Geodermatophilus siccatus]|uniref:EcsC protein family protein n=1 Tax=Geodermatophilus siccatus TaxID=1137991 RepID=A0A1G9R3V3_9ACTN|nr:EcsC family protein [Geodermatophilus siccatus]SDM17800.1 EcsC protein family protein [Geodermatophilus siccatus]
MDDEDGRTQPGADAPDGHQESAVEKVVAALLSSGVDGLGPFKGARQVAEEHLAQHGDAEKAIERVIATHTRLVAATGFATGFGGPLTMPVTIPTDVAVFYALSARCVAAVAHLRGYDIDSDEVRSVVLLSLLGAGGVTLAAEFGAALGTKAALSVLRKLPGRTLMEINKKVGFRLFTKFGTKGVINLGRWVPLVGAGVGAGVNAAAMRATGRYAEHNFPQG